MVKRDAGGKKGKLLCCKLTNLQKVPGVNGLEFSESLNTGQQELMSPAFRKP